MQSQFAMNLQDIQTGLLSTTFLESPLCYVPYIAPFAILVSVETVGTVAQTLALFFASTRVLLAWRSSSALSCGWIPFSCKVVTPHSSAACNANAGAALWALPIE